jgi:hypothetical protein
MRIRQIGFAALLSLTNLAACGGTDDSVSEKTSGGCDKMVEREYGPAYTADEKKMRKGLADEYRRNGFCS